MKISELGQFGLIDAVSKLISTARDGRVDSWKNLLDGIGDDCAVWRSEATNLLAKVDCQVEGVHFTLDILSWQDLGWKALAVNLSDIAAMGGIPGYALVSLGLPPNTEVENVLALYKGMLKLAKRSGTAIVGGNMSSSHFVFVDVNVIGKTGNPQGKYLSRSTAKQGDLIAVTGWLGTAAAGLEMLRGRLNFKPAVTRCFQQAFARPEPRLTEGRLLVENGVKAGIDISDGLLADLGHICKASQVGAVIKLESLPIKSGVKAAFGSKAFEMALSGGEDYQLLFTAEKAVIESVRRVSSYPVTVIGEITAKNAGRVAIVDEQAKRVQPQKTGWDHFKITNNQNTKTKK
jgi:thiamine-monophosphate kinase